jgi:hypothetical protein
MFSDDEETSRGVTKKLMKTTSEGGCTKQTRERVDINTRRMLIRGQSINV